MEKVSVIIPIYNVENLIDRCLQSVVRQTYTDLEIIAVNDGSTDNSPNVIAQYAKTDARIVRVDKPNGGLSDARNAGMDVATGQYLCFLDGDDWWESDFVETMLRHLQQTDADLVCCNYVYVWDDGKRIEKRFLSGLPDVLPPKEALAAYLKQQILASVCIKIFKREICEQYQLRFPKGALWEDLPFTMSYLLHSGSVGVIDRCLYNYYQNRTSISRATDSLNVLQWMQSALQCVEMNEIAHPQEFRDENRCFITKAFIGLLVHSFKSRSQTTRETLRQEMYRYEKRISLRLLSRQEQLLIILYRVNYVLARQVFLQVYKKLQS
ncbi:MAG: glycosyltransferase [Candidatus Symbiothrix sp.]|jgi:glycosyltransferase involved in cell wall biosynthesis|nr:glycosyltransferase [Candidatus Symbiothrix sp.]